MRADVVIKVQNVSKAYTIWSSPSARLHGPMLGQVGQMPFLPARLRDWCRQHSSQSFRNFYALKNVSFSVTRAECLGIVGMNGSGKSTLLQVVAGILEPTAGAVETSGRVTALLELGSGFNPEFTGRENVYLNAAVLGLSRDEVRAKFDEIAAFADIGEFIEQPTKTYSSGMTLRLAFAVQAILNQDILIVDEALAVGDEAFQRKCFSRIESFRANGGTVLFVSHAAGTVVELCDRAILLDHGELLTSGEPKQVIARYHKLLYAPAEYQAAIREEIRSSTPAAVGQRPHLSVALPNQTEARGSTNDWPETFDPEMIPQSSVHYASRGTSIEHPHLETTDGRMVNGLIRGREYVYTYHVKFGAHAFKVRFGMLIKTVSGVEIGGAVTHAAADGLAHVEAGQEARVAFRFRCQLNPGVYFLNAGVLGVTDAGETFLDRHIDVAMFRVQPEAGLTSTAVVDFCTGSEVTLLDGAVADVQVTD